MPHPAYLSAFLAATTTTAVVWLVVGLVTTVALLAMVIALVRHVLILGRAAGRLSDEVTPILEDIDRQSPAQRPSGSRRPGRSARP